MYISIADWFFSCKGSKLDMNPLHHLGKSFSPYFPFFLEMKLCYCSGANNKVKFFLTKKFQISFYPLIFKKRIIWCMSCFYWNKNIIATNLLLLFMYFELLPLSSAFQHNWIWCCKKKCGVELCHINFILRLYNLQ